MKNIIGKIVVIVTVAVAVVGCRSNDVRISGRFVGLNSNMVYLEQMSAAGQSVVDSVALANDGSFHFRIEEVPATPSLYNIMYSSDRIPLLVSRGENIELNAMGSVLSNYTVSGSRESELLREFNKVYLEGQLELYKTVQRYNSANGALRKELGADYSSIYYKIKRNQISFIIENKGTLAAVYALYQRLPGEQYLSSVDSDLIYYRTVADAVSKSYPTSPYLLTLSNDIARMEARISLINNIELRTYPELKGTDMYGREVKLSSLEGNVILVDFWSAEVGNSNAFNAELKEIYEEFEPDGFRVYQVSADTSKATWIAAVQEQRLPWISVCDFKGDYSPMLRSYNVRKLPSNFLIDREGNIVAKDLYSDALAEKLAEIFNR
ncbi:MAG: AhpC/TSA family protein [Alistipes sp.]|nr:AhpC/TSA family protein [Alistipes sp.]